MSQDPIPFPTPDSTGALKVALGNSSTDGRPRIDVELPRRRLQLEPLAAFIFGSQLMATAQAALAESFLADWCGQTGDWPVDQVQLLLGQYRAWLQTAYPNGPSLLPPNQAV